MKDEKDLLDIIIDKPSRKVMIKTFSEFDLFYLKTALVMPGERGVYPV